MEDPMSIIRRAFSPAGQTLGLSGLGTIASQDMNTAVQERRKGLTPSPADQQAYGQPLAASARDLLGG